MITSPRARVALGLTWTALLLAGSGPARPQQGRLTEIPLPDPASRPYSIAPGPDGNLWFTQSDGNRIGRISPSGDLVEFTVPTPASGPYGITAGPDGNLWFTERFANQIGRLTLQGTFAEFPVPTPFSQPWDITAGPDGNLWFTEEEGNQIGRITPDGVITEFSTGTCCFPTGITAGADGNLWFTIEIGDRIGRMTPEGAVTSFLLPSVQVLPWEIAPGPDGNIWFTELAGRHIGRITPSGAITRFPVSGRFSGIAGITTGPDGNLWFTENDSHHIGVMRPDGVVLHGVRTAQGSRPISIAPGPDGSLWATEADAGAIARVELGVAGVRDVLSLASGFAPSVRAAEIGSAVRWTFLAPGLHSVADRSGLDLFDSGPRAPVSTFLLKLTAAGTYVYGDKADPFAAATLEVPVILPSSGSVGIPFPVTWAARPAPRGRVYEVEVEVPGGAGFEPWLTLREPGAEFTATAPGVHRFRARTRDLVTGASTFPSRPRSILIE